METRVAWSVADDLALDAATQTSFHDAKPLAWAGWDFKPRDIPPAPNVHFYVDLTSVLKKQSGWMFSVEKRSLRGPDQPHKLPGNVPIPFDRDWHNLRAVAVRKA